MLDNFNLTDFLLTMFVLVIAITIHEFAHALTADRLGDDTPRSQGRISLSPVDHLDPLGTVMMVVSSIVGIGIGWGRPVQYNPANLKSPRWDPLKIAVWGPISNVLQALVFTGALRLVDREGWLIGNDLAYRFLELGIWINVALALFNMIPIPPLDGSKVLSGLLPVRQAQVYDRFMAQWGLLLFFALVMTRATSLIMGPPLNAIFHFLAG